ncbi:segregation and condensation protein A [Patescibacteria group bacterium]
MSYEVKLEQFEGPLHVLLQLIEAEKLDISEVSLSRVTDGYLKIVQENPQLPPEELADFLVVASRLLLIKSKLLLPYLFPADDDEGEGDLEAQLRMYKAYLDAAQVIEKTVGGRRFLYVREKPPRPEIGFAPPKSLRTDQMRELMLGVCERLEPEIEERREARDRTVSLHDKIGQLRKMLVRAKRISFRAFIKSSGSRMEMIVSFLALLELVKQKSVAVTQEGRFEDISITGIEKG